MGLAGVVYQNCDGWHTQCQEPGGHGVGTEGLDAPTVSEIGVVRHLLNRETGFGTEIWCKKIWSR